MSTGVFSKGCFEKNCKSLNLAKVTSIFSTSPPARGFSLLVRHLRVKPASSACYPWFNAGCAVLYLICWPVVRLDCFTSAFWWWEIDILETWPKCAARIFSVHSTLFPIILSFNDLRILTDIFNFEPFLKLKRPTYKIFNFYHEKAIEVYIFLG